MQNSYEKMIETISRSSKMMVVCGIGGLNVTIESEITDYDVFENGVSIYGKNNEEVLICSEYRIQYDPEEEDFKYKYGEYEFIIRLE